MKINKYFFNKNSKLFDQFLSYFQEDIKRIVGKFKKSFHHLSDEEVYSECNIHLLKNKDKIVKSFGDKTLEESEFKKIAYHYTKNEVVWSHYRYGNQSYVKRKRDGVVYTEDGEKSLFEISLETLGVDNPDIDDDKNFLNSSIKNFFHILKEYCYILSETESKILSFLEKGMNQDEMAEELNVTRQAVSASFINIKEKLTNYFNFKNILQGDSLVPAGKCMKALNSVFEPDSNYNGISEKESDFLKDFVKKNPYQFTVEDLNIILFSKRFTNQQIINSLKGSRASNLIKKKPCTVFSKSNSDKILKMFKKGLSIQEISESTNFKKSSVLGLRSFFVKKGLLEKCESNRRVFSQDIEELILTMAKEGLNSVEISKKLKIINSNYNYSPKSIAVKLTHFTQLGLITRRSIARVNTRRMFSEKDRKIAIKLFNKDKTAQEIAEVLGCENYRSVISLKSNLSSQGLLNMKDK